MKTFFLSSRAGLALALCLGSSLGEAQASWFRTSEQEARDFFAAGKYAEAANTFEDHYRRGVAQYRNGDYQSAAQSFGQVKREDVRLDALYNLGNARFRLGSYENAVEAYESVLKEDPFAEDARHNLALARMMLAKVEEE